ncbi:MAG: LysR family transcriptional activator of nhaA [Kiritimatiellia bacterium]|jgi:LysR family transcriptional activator of nhaA
MNDLNYQHLRYFWMVAREGNLTRAAARLRLAPSTVSAQIKTLSEHLGYPLFERRGRQLHLTEYGQVVREYADDIFALGEELVDAVRSETRLRHAYRLRVGVSNNLPKSVAYKLLAPALAVEGFPVHLVCREDHVERLVADLAIHHLDLVLADAPVALASDVAADSILLGGTGVSLLGTPALVSRHLANFPLSLNDAPVLLPESGSNMRELMERYFQQRNIRPRVVAEFGDSALLKAFGQAGSGLFPVATLVAETVCSQYRCVTLGTLDSVLRENFYAITAANKRKNPAVAAVLDAAASALAPYSSSSTNTYG